jgi:hypothetical protein
MSFPEKLQPSQDYNGIPDNFESDEQMLDFTNSTLLLTMKPEAVAAWWQTPNYYLNNATPADVWPDNPREVLELAESYREQGAD